MKNPTDIILLITILSAMAIAQLSVDRHIKNNGGKNEWVTERKK